MSSFLQNIDNQDDAKSLSSEIQKPEQEPAVKDDKPKGDQQQGDQKQSDQKQEYLTVGAQDRQLQDCPLAAHPCRCTSVNSWLHHLLDATAASFHRIRLPWLWCLSGVAVLEPATTLQDEGRAANLARHSGMACLTARRVIVVALQLFDEDLALRTLLGKLVRFPNVVALRAEVFTGGFIPVIRA